MAKVNVDKMMIRLEDQFKDWYQALNQGMQKEAIQKAADQAVSYLQTHSPRGRRSRNYYAQTWKADRNSHYSGAWRYSMTVYNDKNYRLTHLLEYGHLTRDGQRKTKEIPHIQDAEDITEEYLVDAVLDLISKI